MKTLEEIKQIIRDHKPELEKKYKVKSIGIFGSYVRGEQNEGSDIDILADFSIPTLHNFIGVIDLLEELIGKEVEMIMPDSVSPYLKPYIENEVVWI